MGATALCGLGQERGYAHGCLCTGLRGHPATLRQCPGRTVVLRGGCCCGFHVQPGKVPGSCQGPTELLLGGAGPPRKEGWSRECCLYQLGCLSDRPVLPTCHPAQPPGQTPEGGPPSPSAPSVRPHEEARLAWPWRGPGQLPQVTSISRDSGASGQSGAGDWRRPSSILTERDSSVYGVLGWQPCCFPREVHSALGGPGVLMSQRPHLSRSPGLC